MKTLVTTTTVKETRGHNFKNGWTYVEIWVNNTLKDNYFAETQHLFPDGSVKKDGRKFFYSSTPDEPEKIVKPINYLKFNYFDNLFSYDYDGKILDINGNEVG